MNHLLKTLGYVFGMAGAFVSHGQQLLDIKPLTSNILSVHASYGRYWNNTKIEDSLSTIEKDHLKAINRGQRIELALLFRFSEDWDIGFQYTHLTTSHTTEPVIVLFNSGVALQGPVTDAIFQNFYGLRLDSKLELNDYTRVRLGVAAGANYYINYADYAGYNYFIEGASPMIDFKAELDYRFDYNWGLSIKLGYATGFISEPLYSDSLYNKLPLAGNSIKLSNFYVGAGVSFNLNKKEKKKNRNPRGTKPKAPEQQAPRRFE